MLVIRVRGIWGILHIINRFSKIKSSVNCGAVGYALVLVTSYNVMHYYGLLLQKAVSG